MVPTGITRYGDSKADNAKATLCLSATSGGCGKATAGPVKSALPMICSAGKTTDGILGDGVLSRAVFWSSFWSSFEAGRGECMAKRKSKSLCNGKNAKMLVLSRSKVNLIWKINTSNYGKKVWRLKINRSSRCVSPLDFNGDVFVYFKSASKFAWRLPMKKDSFARQKIHCHSPAGCFHAVSRCCKFCLSFQLLRF